MPRARSKTVIPLSRIESQTGGNRSALLRRFLSAAFGVWTGKSRRTAWLLTALLFAIAIVQLFIQYRINVWNKDVFNALERKNAAAVMAQAWVFLPLALGGVTLAILSVYTRMRAQRTWREWLSTYLIERWLSNGYYYQLNLLPGDHDTPEGRIADDARVATDAPIDFALGIFSSVVTVIMFIGVLWAVGGSITLSLSRGPMTIPGYLVVAAMVYALISSSAMLLFGRRFVAVSEHKNQSEADFRFLLTRVRENGESIALLKGDREERASLSVALQGVIGAWRDLAGQHMRNALVANTNYVVAPVIPIILCAPKYLAGEMSLGDVMQASAAFVQVQGAFNWIVDNFPRLSDWRASARRVGSLLVGFDRLDQTAKEGAIERLEHDPDDTVIRLHEVSVALSDGTIVVDEADVVVRPGERVLVMGESGSGKSTLIRAIAGLWPWGHGTISLGRNSKMLLMPQRPYIPLGSLRRVATYPLAPDAIDDATFQDTMKLVGLGELLERADDEDIAWHRILSGGEQQRLAFARLFFNKPTIIIMDEATSALDPDSQAKLMRLTIERMPTASILSVGHRTELAEFHDRTIRLERREGGAQIAPDRIGKARRRLSGLWGRLRRRPPKDATP